MKHLLCPLAICLSLLLSCSPKEQAASSSPDNEVTLGELQHGFNLSDATKEKFDEGLLLLHNFEYEDATTAFEQVIEVDSTEILGHWGEAMCQYKALWRLQNTDNGKAILSRLGDTREERLATINDPIKQIMWEMIEIMYGEGEFEERNQQLATHLATAHDRYPKHQEIAAFYALSLIWATEEYGDGSDDLRLAASITDKIAAVNPQHPGALHYKIHALDGPTSAADAHAAADAYAKVAADAAHALHMPSHIYLAVGEWEGVVNSNVESYSASITRMKEQELTDGARGHHSLSWLHYGLLQQGRYDEAETVLNDILTYAPNDPTKQVRGYLVGMQSRQLVASGVVAESTKIDTEVNVADIGLNPKSARSFLRAQIAYQKKDMKTLHDEVAWLGKKTLMASDQVQSDGIVMCAAGTSRYTPTENAVNSAEVVMNQIKGMIALLEGDNDQFEALMKKAVMMEDQTDYPTGPPSIAKPSYEQYGEWLLTQGKYAEAQKQFDKALLRMPKRSKSLIGKMQALKKMNKLDDAKQVETELKSILAKADTDVNWI